MLMLVGQHEGQTVLHGERQELRLEGVLGQQRVVLVNVHVEHNVLIFGELGEGR